MRTAKAAALTVIVLVLVVWIISYGLLRSGGLSARKKPGKLEYAIANYALGVSMPASAKAVANPIKATPDTLKDANKYYSENCSVCHANNGSGKTDLARGLSPEVPDLRSAHIQRLADGQMFYIIKNGVRFTAMPSWNFNDKQIWELVAFIRRFANQNASHQPLGKAAAADPPR
jgi:mono/diheme cytochrome c family protein